MPNITVEHGGETYILVDDGATGEANFIGSRSTDTNVFWIYECEGAHKGLRIRIAVKNVRREAHNDGERTFYTVTHNGWFWADSLTALEPNVAGWYAEAVVDAVKGDYNN